ncbi:hypothetical protein QQS21_001310 [Conoideocrella luteorostrata]|uniref:Methyltransferase domain-containing protein n=1 Tax=Conoideocrella luteorostrata TaxID=1105319 RepID=A0AAJ0CY70_9HYPO|nr:hypothetical protein QQS21_001310 [Conoideocrella luteorostrata]
MADTEPFSAAEHFSAYAAKYEANTGGCTRELARHVLDLSQLQPMLADSANVVILDNACGNGIVSEEIIRRCHANTIPRIYAADAAEGMVNIAKAKFAALDVPSDRVTAEVMRGESLNFPSGTFTHSITNLGILFYDDGVQGVRELHRTLRPGGVAVVTSWEKFGYMAGAVHPAQRAARPHDAPVRLPIDEKWSDPAHIEQIMKDGGFEEVEIQSRIVHWAGPNIRTLADMAAQSFMRLVKGLNEEEERVFKEALPHALERSAKHVTLVDGTPGVGVEMVAIVAICRKATETQR